jgi:hypothetical protein
LQENSSGGLGSQETVFRGSAQLSWFMSQERDFRQVVKA